VALLVSGVACPPYGGYFHLTVETGSIEIGRIKKAPTKAPNFMLGVASRKGFLYHFA